MHVTSKLVRETKGLEPKAKVYIVPEGDVTEIDYFVGIKKYADELKIKPLIEIIPIENDESQFGESHPLKKIENFHADVENGVFLYEKDFDKVCMVVDRDKQSFHEEQYDVFLNKCDEYGYFPYISNPTFEVFLLMHDDAILKLDRKKMLGNKRVNRGKRYTEIKLSEIFNCNKRRINFEEFKPKVANAIQNEKLFCEDVYELKNNLGSNVGVLLESIIEK